MLDIEGIKKILPHREPFLMIDKVEEYEPGKSARGYKAVSGNEWFFMGHFAQKKVMPGVLMVEAIAQMGGIALLTMEDMKGKLALLGKIKSARFYGMVTPGDLLEIHTEIETVKDGIGIGKGKILSGGKRVATCELVFAIADAKE
ncbi:MAG: 3-hydroxyacyl-ACP dehydratase FabZ [Christensenellales bacterium]|jgi:3-hydroxyacyl-[acyl-carrier-protein] dehydratase